MALINVRPFADAVTAQSPVRWIASSATAPDAVRDRMTELLRDRIGLVLPLNPPESLTSAAARDALRVADPSQTLFLVTDSAALSELMVTNGWRDMARVGLELVNPRIWGRTLYVFARGGTSTRGRLSRAGCAGRVPHRPKSATGQRRCCGVWATSTSALKR